MRIYGLIGFPLSHSFSEKYFAEKFLRLNIGDAKYRLFELKAIQDLKKLLQEEPDIQGLNVTIPYKQTVIPFLDHLSDSARQVGAVNVIKIEPDGRLVGYNSDHYGFLQSLAQSLGYNMRNVHSLEGYKALVLGTGGAAKAVESALNALKISYHLVSRTKKNVSALLYENMDEKIIREHQLIINTTPLGMYPHVETCPNIPYQYLNQQHFCYDLVYNPEQTLFLKKAQKQGARTKSGLEMLHLQAEKAWEIWNS